MPRCAGSHAEAPPPSVLLALVAASIVHAFDPRWLSRPLGELAAAHGVRPERPSRVRRRVHEAFERAVAQASQRGRPVRTPGSSESARLRATEALLAIAAEVIRVRGIGRGRLREQLVVAQARLASEHQISRRSFCQALGLSERTFRAWVARARQPSERVRRPPPAEPRPRRPRRRGRFALEVVPAGVQAMADTTDWKLFGVPLKVIAIQDPGARHERLWEAAEVATGEDAERVIQVVRAALGDRPGTQLITDQGTPYLADASRAVFEELELEHAPQREGDPIAKATLERSFRTVKEALAPLAALTHRLAEAVPALGEPRFAAAAGRLLAGTFLAVYLCARSRTATPAPALSAASFAALAEENREQARAEDRSRRLTLERIHAQYDMPTSRTAFVRAFRHHRVEDLLEAERQMERYACRCHARACDRYFAAVASRVRRERAAQRQRQRDELHRCEEERRAARAHQHERERLRGEPEEWLGAGLERVAVQWRAERRAFVLGDPMRSTLEHALRALVEADPDHALDRVEVGWRRWAARHAADPVRLAAVRSVFERAVRAALPTPRSLTHDPVRRILEPLTNRRPPPQPPLRI